MAKELNCAILLAAGSGSRMQGVVEDKILALVQGKTVFSYSIQAIAASESVHILCIVYRDQAQKAKLGAILDDSIQERVIWTQGGNERQESVLNGLEALPPDTTHVLIHDCARPLISTSLIAQVLATARHDGAACSAHPVVDTIKRIPQAGALKKTELEDLERDRLWAMETPQAFRHKAILKAYQHVKSRDLRITDDCAAAARVGIPTTLIHNPKPNPKITKAADLDYIEWLLSRA